MASEVAKTHMKRLRMKNGDVVEHADPDPDPDSDEDEDDDDTDAERDAPVSHVVESHTSDAGASS